MSYLEIGGQRHTILVGELTIGSDASSAIQLSGEGVAPRHAIVQGLPDGQVAIRKADENVEVLINGVRLGPQPSPLLHGDKVAVAGQEFRFVDERRSGSTQLIEAVDPAAMAALAKRSAIRVATAGTGGRLVSLTDGREYAITGRSLLIGRDASCDAVVTSKNVSRRHAEIVLTPKGYLLVDNSTNGTVVNGKRVERHLLARSDVIQCGEHEFRFYADVAPEVSPAKPAPLAASAVASPSPRPAAPSPAPPQKVQKPAPSPEPAAGAARRLSDTLFGVPGVPRPGAPPRRPPGAVQKLSNTMHGIPGVPRPGAPTGSAAPPTRRAPSDTPALANLLVRSGPLKGQRFPIRVPVVNVGRAEYNDIVLPDDSVSTTHAKLQRREGIWVLVDLESTNGTRVDGDRVQGEVPLAPGALIRFGDVKTIFEPTDDSAAAQEGSSTKVISAFKLPNSHDPNG